MKPSALPFCSRTSTVMVSFIGDRLPEAADQYKKKNKLFLFVVTR